MFDIRTAWRRLTAKIRMWQHYVTRRTRQYAGFWIWQLKMVLVPEFEWQFVVKWRQILL